MDVRDELMEGRRAIRRLGRVVEVNRAPPPYAVFDAAGVEIEPVTAFLRDLALGHSSPLTCRSYGYGMLRWFRPGVTEGAGRDDVISRLCATDGVGDDEIAMLAMALLFAGHETTVVQLGFGALLLLSHPDQWQALAESPDRIPDAVEEILRAPGKGGGGIPRYARTDFDIGGVTIHAGDLVMLDNGAANHDPAAVAW
ncbi:cytochrome P450 [Streptomyces sp. N2-109]|uniref:Cytochrome P450 n=1 Tax=Streptomyces gossypii TaxID=2883101 RepID=A0ABT2JLI7_9ACTN|nr:cytochrome P450 [Streptomyces gossypii]MCT2588747.1 cytochrome P450 [Streptomyces gossypii]